MVNSDHDPPGHGHAGGIYIGDHSLITGGDFTINNYVYPPSTLSVDQLVKQYLCPISGPSNIDDHLFHNSSEHTSDLHTSASAHAERIIQTVQCSSDVVTCHELPNIFYRQFSRLVALALARHANSQGILLATLLLRPIAQRGSRRYIVPTLAYQLVDAIPQTAEPMLRAIHDNPSIFKLNVAKQLEALIELPLKRAAQEASSQDKLRWPSVIVMDGPIDGSDAQEITSMLRSLASDRNLGIKLSVVAIRGAPFTKAATAMIGYVMVDGALYACYFSWRVHARTALAHCSTHQQPKEDPTSKRVSSCLDLGSPVYF